MVHGDYWQKLGPEGLMAILGFDGIWGQDWLRWAQLWFGTHLALGANGLPPLAPFGLIGLGQKGPKWPMDRDYGPRTVEAIGGLNRPKRLFRPGPP
ncbi:hypothetical protein O181_048610 [Austropuccinia psidii MF-1]|uniref:Uncharacterized protein n=1 Tax=Austropuccinia psidii MF-1 TaxID=1389203 RepID=A0A9Q3DXK6_9BASI|nr:hypothetical protein [Austropuccinia psidii MF-1]